MRRKVYWAMANVVVAIILVCQVTAFATCISLTCQPILNYCANVSGCVWSGVSRVWLCCCTPYSNACCQYKCIKDICTDANSTTTCSTSWVKSWQRVEGPLTNSTCVEQNGIGQCSSLPSTTSTTTVVANPGMNVLSFEEG